MTKQMREKLEQLRAVEDKFDSREQWLDSDGKCVAINRTPIDWVKANKPMYTINEITIIRDERYESIGRFLRESL